MQVQSTIDSFLQAVTQNLPIISLVVAMVLGNILWLMFRPRIKGKVGEAIVNLGALQKLDPLRYKSFNDIYLPRSDRDGTTQIDHVVVSAHGIFVIETKNYAGWIFGSGVQTEWLQMLKGGVKFPFQNPLRQNWLHMKSLAKELDLPTSVFHPIVYFAGDSTFKTAMPENVMSSGLKTYIEGYRAILLADEEVRRVNEHLARLNEPRAKKKARNRHLKRSTAGV